MGETVLSIREKQILMILLKAEDYLSLMKIASCLNVSEKTISRDIHAIKQKFSGQNVIRYQRGKGYGINSFLGIHTLVQRKLEKNDFGGMDVDTRRRRILALLLLQAPEETSINKLAECYFISKASIVNDLNVIETELSRQRLRLVRGHQGTHIEGAEANIRQLLMRKMSEFAFDTEEILLSSNEVAEDHDLYAFFSRKDIGFVKLLLDKVEQILQGKIKDPYYINIFTHLLILLKRANSNDRLKDAASGQSTVYENSMIADCSKMVIEELKSYLGCEISANEFFYIYQYLCSSRIEGEYLQTKVAISGSEAEKDFVEDLIYQVSGKIACDMTTDVTLKNALLLHIAPMSKRIRGEIFISNPLKDEIKKDFSKIFFAVEDALRNQSLKPELQQISEDEIAYIAVYFQASLEKRIQQVRIGIVCSSGVGTSHLLAARVKRAFPDWKIVDIVSIKHADEFKPEDVDVILTTVRLERKDIPSVLVSAIFNEVDVVKVKQAL